MLVEEDLLVLQCDSVAALCSIWAGRQRHMRLSVHRLAIDAVSYRELNELPLLQPTQLSLALTLISPQALGSSAPGATALLKPAREGDMRRKRFVYTTPRARSHLMPDAEPNVAGSASKRCSSRKRPRCVHVHCLRACIASAASNAGSRCTPPLSVSSSPRRDSRCCRALLQGGNGFCTVQQHHHRAAAGQSAFIIMMRQLVLDAVADV